MIRLVSKILLVISAAVGMLPSDTCLLTLVGACHAECCHKEIERDHHYHSELAANRDHKDSNHNSHEATHEHHGDECVSLSIDGAVAQAQRATKIDSYSDAAMQNSLTALIAFRDESTAGLLSTRARSFPESPPQRLYLKIRSILI